MITNTKAIKSNKPCWLVKNFNPNTQQIQDYDVLPHIKDIIKKLKKKSNSIDEFSEVLLREIKYRYWSRAEYELILHVETDKPIKLSPWCGCKDPISASITVTDTEAFSWSDFARHIASNPFSISVTNIETFSYAEFAKYIAANPLEIKIDVYDQIYFKWEEFVDYCWNYNKKTSIVNKI